MFCLIMKNLLIFQNLMNLLFKELKIFIQFNSKNNLIKIILNYYFYFFIPFAKL